MRDGSTGTGDYTFLGGALCLDFANTADWHASEHPRELLGGYGDLLDWSRQAGLLAEPLRLSLARENVRRPTDAAAVYQQAIQLREAIYRIFSRVAAGRRPDGSDLAALNGALTEAMERLKIVPKDQGFTWDWAGDGGLDRMLWPVARSAGELLTSDDLGRVRECPSDDGCGWLFLDTSRNRTRKWCDMSSCGNRAKARRHYEKESGKRA